MLEASAIQHLVVHCSDTPDDEPIGAREIHQMHLGFGWHGVGYHRVINRQGIIEHARPDYWQGAHVLSAGIGILAIRIKPARTLMWLRGVRREALTMRLWCRLSCNRN